MLDGGFDFASALADQRFVSASGPKAREELALIDGGWRFAVMEDVRNTVRDGKMVLERTAPPAVRASPR